jgi:hypothetical protein
MNCSITPPWRPAPTDPPGPPPRAPATDPDAPPPSARTRHRSRIRPPVGRRSPHLRPTSTMSHGPCAFCLGYVPSRLRLRVTATLGAPRRVTRSPVRSLLPFAGRIRVYGRIWCIIVHRKLPEARILPELPIPAAPRHTQLPPRHHTHQPLPRASESAHCRYSTSVRNYSPMRPDAHHSPDDQPGPGRLAMLPLTGPVCREPECPGPPGKVRVRWRRYWLESSPLRRPGRPQAAAAKTVSKNSTNVIACTLVQYRQMLPMMNSSAYTR